MKNKTRHLTYVFILAVTVGLSGIYGCPHKKNKDPDNPNSPCNIAIRMSEKLMNKGDYISSHNELMKGLEECPNKPELHYMLGINYFHFEKYKESEEEYMLALKLQPHYPPALNNLGNVYLATGQYDKAIETFTKAHEDFLNRDVEQTLVNLGIAYMKKGDKAAAKDFFEQAISRAPSFCPALINLGSLYSGEDRHKEALGAFRSATQECPSVCSGHLYYGVELNIFGKKEEACSSFKTASSLGNINNSCGVRARDYLKLLRCP